MTRLLQFVLTLLFVVAPLRSQEETPSPPVLEQSVIEPKPEPEPESEEDTTEAVVKNNQVEHRERQRDRDRNRDRWQQHRKHGPDNVQVRGDVVVAKGETSSDIVVVAGTLRIEGEVDGDVVAIASKAFIDGIVHGTVVVVPGPVRFGPNADVRNETVVVGEYIRDPGAKLDRFQPVRVPEIVPIITGAKDFIFDGLFMLRPLPPNVRWVWMFHGVMLLLLVGMTLLFPKPVEVGAKAIADRPVVSIFSGFLTAILFIPVVLLLVVTVIGIVAVPFAIAGLIIASLFGKASVLEFMGQQLGRNLRIAFFESPVIALLIGAAILALLYMVPVLGLLVWCVATLLGLGAIMVATASALGNQPSEPTPTGVAAISPAPVMPSTEPVVSTTTTLTTTPVVLQRVGFWKRAFAAFLDWFFMAIPLVGIIALTGPPALLVFPLILMIYFVAMWTWKGTSIGKICLGLKIVRTDGTDIDFAVALVRSLAAFFSFIVAFLGFFWAGWDKEKQSWHDKIAGTVVIRVPKGVSLL